MKVILYSQKVHLFFNIKASHFTDNSVCLLIHLVDRLIQFYSMVRTEPNSGLIYSVKQYSTNDRLVAIAFRENVFIKHMSHR